MNIHNAIKRVLQTTMKGKVVNLLFLLYYYRDPYYLYNIYLYNITTVIIIVMFIVIMNNTIVHILLKKEMVNSII